MRKSRNKKWRKVYPYQCSGCTKKRVAFDYERKKLGLCTRCERDKPNENQVGLFDTPSIKNELTKGK